MDPPARPLVLPVLGIPVRFDAPEPALAEVVESHFGAWRDLAYHLLSDPGSVGPRVRLRRSTVPGSVTSAIAAPLRIRTHPSGRLRLRQPGRLDGQASLDGMRARLRVATEGLGDPATIGNALDTLILFLLTRLDREPVHAAAIAAGDRGLVLAGPSGVGKSTIALAALRAGLRVITDDAVYVQLQPRTRVWGMARPLHVPPATAERFPETARGTAIPRPGGGRKVPVELAPRDQPFRRAPVLERTALCVLEAGAGPAVEPMTVDDAVQVLGTRLDPGFDAFRASIPARLRAVSQGGAWRVIVGDRPETVLPALVEILTGSHD